MGGMRNQQECVMSESEKSPWLIDRTLPCLQCDYDLKNLTGPMVDCPECGFIHDLRDPDRWIFNDPDFSSERVGAPARIATWMSIIILLGSFRIQLFSDWITYPVFGLVTVVIIYHSFILARHWWRAELNQGTSLRKIGFAHALAAVAIWPMPLVLTIGHYASIKSDWMTLLIILPLGPSLLCLVILKKMLRGKYRHSKKGVLPWERYCEAIKTPNPKDANMRWIRKNIS